MTRNATTGRLRMTYSVNGQPPLFRSAQDARAYALRNPGTWKIGRLELPGDFTDDYAHVSIFRDGIIIGYIIAPMNMSAGYWYWWPTSEATIYPVLEDGSYDPYSIEQVCLQPTVWFEVVTEVPSEVRTIRKAEEFLEDYEGTTLPFESIERGLRWYVEKSDCITRIWDASGNEVGFVARTGDGRKGRILYMNFRSKKIYEIGKNGRIGKPIDPWKIRYELEGILGMPVR